MENSTYNAGKTSGVLRGGASGANRCYVLAHCGGGWVEQNWKYSSAQLGLELGKNHKGSVFFAHRHFTENLYNFFTS